MRATKPNAECGAHHNRQEVREEQRRSASLGVRRMMDQYGAVLDRSSFDRAVTRRKILNSVDTHQELFSDHQCTQIERKIDAMVSKVMNSIRAFHVRLLWCMLMSTDCRWVWAGRAASFPPQLIARRSAPSISSATATRTGAGRGRRDSTRPGRSTPSPPGYSSLSSGRLLPPLF